MIKADCVKVSGKLDYIEVNSRMNKGVKANFSIGGNLFAKVTMEDEFFENLNSGDDVTLYMIARVSGGKWKHEVILYGYEKNGKKVFAEKYRWQVPSLLAVYGAIVFCAVFVVGWPLSALILVNLGLKSGGMVVVTTFAFIEASLAGGFFLYAARRFLRVSAAPEGWGTIDATDASGRFSKLR